MTEHVEDLLSAYMDEELSEAEAQLVEDHLKGCSACRAEFEQLKELSMHIAFTYDSVEAPVGFTDQVLSGLEAPKRVIEKQTQVRRWVIALVAIFLLTVLSLEMAPGLSFFAAIVTFIFNVGFELLRFISFMISKIPYLLGMVCAVAGMLILLSLWSLKRLLGFGMYT